MWIKYMNQNNQEALLKIYGVDRCNSNLVFITAHSTTDWSMWGNIDTNSIPESFAIKTFDKIEKAIAENETILDLTKI